MSSKDLSLSAELRFDLPEFEPTPVLVEQLSLLAAAPAPSASPTRRFSRRAVAGVFAGLLLASGTAYAARGHIAPVFDAVIGHGAQDPAHPTPPPSTPPQSNDSGNDAAGHTNLTPGKRHEGSDQSQGQQSESGQRTDDAPQQASTNSDDSRGQSSTGGSSTGDTTGSSGGSDIGDSNGSGSGAGGSGAGQQ